MSSKGQADWRPTATPEVLRARADLLARIRAFFAQRGVLEVDTPLRAAGRIPEAHIGVLGCDGGVLLPSPEPYLKRLLAAGSGDVYQLAHAFRAGERGRHHGEEFMLCEWYRGGYDAPALMDELCALLAYCGGPEGAVPRVSYAAVFERYAGVHPLADADALARAARDRGVAPGEAREGDAVFWRDVLMGLCVQPKLGLDGPLLLTDYPAMDSPLAEVDAGDGRWAQRFELFWRGVELANGGVERRDADALDEAVTDARFVAAMRAGLPVCAGVALGVDRLLMLLCGVDSLIQVLPFSGA